VTTGVRVDKWLWAVRLFKTRTSAAKACDAGAVRIGTDPAKAARRVRPGDTVTVSRRDRTVVVEVVTLLEKRVGAPIAQAAYIDHSPPVEPPTSARGIAFGERSRGEGRPTKRDRRRIDRFRGRG